MATRAYVVKKIGDQYIPVLQEPPTGVRRPLYVGGGIVLGCAGIRRGGLAGAAAMAAGAYLVTRGVLGYDPMRLAASWLLRRGLTGSPNDAPSYQNDSRRKAGQLATDAVEEASMESFPASDAPAWTAVERIG